MPEALRARPRGPSASGRAAGGARDYRPSFKPSSHLGGGHREGCGVDLSDFHKVEGSTRTTGLSFTSSSSSSFSSSKTEGHGALMRR
eukprot:scaffold55253_cov61-Phaeocystis_antarctica.AAC.5